jgi:hypothetical protein
VIEGSAHREIMQSPNNSYNISGVAFVIWIVAPFCWNQQSHFSTFRRELAIVFGVYSFTEEKEINYTQTWNFICKVNFIHNGCTSRIKFQNYQQYWSFLPCQAPPVYAWQVYERMKFRSLCWLCTLHSDEQAFLEAFIKTVTNFQCRFPQIHNSILNANHKASHHLHCLCHESVSLNKYRPLRITGLLDFIHHPVF